MAGFGRRHPVSLREKRLTALLPSCYPSKNPKL
jgi:hypothetical protein